MTSTATSSKRKGSRPRRKTAKIPVRQGRKLKLRHLLFLLLLLSGIVPLLISSWRMIEVNRDLLTTKETELLTNSAQAFARELGARLARRKDQLRQLGLGLVAPPGFATVQGRMVAEWSESYLYSFLDDHPEILAFHILNQDGVGRSFGARAPQAIEQVMNDSWQQALDTEAPVYSFVILSQANETGVVISVPIPSGNEILVVRSLVPVALDDLMATARITKREIFLVQANGQLLWSPGQSPTLESAIMDTTLIGDFARYPGMTTTTELGLKIGNDVKPTLARVVQVPETGWGVVAHKPKAQAFEEVQNMIQSAVISSVVLIILALAVALVAARFLSHPIQQLVEASHEIAAGNFDRRVKTRGLGFEIADLAEDFNRMSDTVESYIEQLRRAAEANRELFISSIRAFAAAIDAKDPYTRGHSERVAAYSRSISRYLGLPKDQQERVWISAVLHDVGKIGIEDRILKKVGVLTPEEFEQMKLHPVIGAEIVEPILALREMLPGIRWHHEAWNGSGYPDNLNGEQIPLMARIIGVADTFDAITTTRPYQNAYSTDYALQTIKKLTGKRFDPKIVQAFLLAYEAGHIKVDKEEADNMTSKVNAPAIAANPAPPTPAQPAPTTTS